MPPCVSRSNRCCSFTTRRTRQSPTPPASDHQVVFAPGDVFAGRYRMVARIGRGGMGDVWRADDLVLEHRVALKLIQSAGPAARERIFNEVRLARQITHPAVCRVFDVGEAQGVIFFSMELVQGEDLAALLRRVGRLPSEKVVDIGRQLCAGLAAAHAQGVLHRDLKPANVLIDNDGFVRITDFGIAIPRAEADRHSFTGTPAYMAPEQWTPGMAVSERTDVYALGLVLYELLLGPHVRHQAKNDAPLPPPSTLVAERRSPARSPDHAALAPDPNDRPASVRDMAAMLAVVGHSRSAGCRATRASGSPAGRALRGQRGWRSPPRSSLLVIGVVVPRLAGRRHAGRAATRSCWRISKTPPAIRCSTAR